MKRTNLGALVGASAFVTAAVAIVMPVLYGHLSAIPVTVSATLWLMAVICTALALKVRAAKAQGAHGIGLDRSQLNPLTVMNAMLLGKASAWSGAVVGAAYAGIGVYVIPRVGELAAASADLGGIVAGTLGGVAMSAGGYFLETQCAVPPPPDGATV